MRDEGGGIRGGRSEGGDMPPKALMGAENAQRDCTLFSVFLLLIRSSYTMGTRTVLRESSHHLLALAGSLACASNVPTGASLFGSLRLAARMMPRALTVPPGRAASTREAEYSTVLLS